MKNPVKIIPWIAFVLVFALLLKLGFWQLSRADEKQQLLDARAVRQLAEPVTVNQLLDSAKIQFTPLLLQGKWLQSWSFYLDNRIQNGITGYNLFSLFADNSGKVIFVDRGWLAIDKTRNFKFIAPQESQIQVMGYAYQPDLYKVVTVPNPQQHKVIPLPGLHIEQLANFLKDKELQLAPFILRQTFPETENGLLRQWNIVSTPPQKNLGYAVQWFAMALTLLVLLIIMISKKRANKTSSKEKQ